MAKFIVFIYSQNCTGKAGDLVTGGRERAARLELAQGLNGNIGADIVMYEFDGALEALEFGGAMVMDNMATPSGAHKRKVGRSIFEAASEANSSDLIADLQRARKVLEDRQQ